MRVPNLEALIHTAMQPRRFTSYYGKAYDGYYASVPGDVCQLCGFKLTEHVLRILPREERLYTKGKTMYLQCIDETS